MSETKELLRRGVGGYEPMPDAFERVLARRDRKRRNQRVAAGVVGIAVFVLAAIGFARLLGSERTPASGIPSPFEGTWVSTSDADGGTQTMTVTVSADGAVEVVVRDDVATVCSGTPSRMVGTGRIEAGTALVIPSPVYMCDDGSEPEALSGPPLEDQLGDLTFVLDPQTDTLSDRVGGVWLREEDDPSTTEEPLVNLEPLWPQTSIEELRQAQELADAGDPRYTWQVDRNLGQLRRLGQHHPQGAEIFDRFLEEELGWESFLWHEAFAHPDGLDDGEVVFIRCAPGATNPLYPDADPECAPTIDEVRYEAVHIQVAQLVRQDPEGIWVVTDWEIVEPVAQADPRVVEAEGTTLLEDFLQARLDGAGAEAFVDLGYDPFADERVDREVPLLYATSTGAPYERSEFEIVHGPAWPSGRMAAEVTLFAEDGETVVEQAFSLERDDADRLRLVYDFVLDGGAKPAPATTENGDDAPVEFGFLDGQVTYRATFPVGPHENLYLWKQRRLLLFLADPRPIGPGCEEGPAPADAEALAESIGFDSDLEAGAPVPVTIGGISALQIDVVMARDAISCPWQLPNTSSSTPLLLDRAPFFAVYGADRARVYLLDLPPGGSARVLAIAVMSDEDSFERTLSVTAPIVDSIEFRAP
jgi:hypothetical protein